MCPPHAAVGREQRQGLEKVLGAVPSAQKALGGNVNLMSSVTGRKHHPDLHLDGRVSSGPWEDGGWGLVVSSEPGTIIQHLCPHREQGPRLGLWEETPS